MDTSQQLRAAIASQNLPMPSASFLTDLLASRNPPLPIPSLVATAKARLLACDLATSPLIERSGAMTVRSMPSAALDAQSKETKLPHDTFFQILDIENLTLSRWEQVEELQAIERGETTRGREIIRVADEDDDEDGTGSSTPDVRAAAKNATHRLVLQDAKGQKIFAVELVRNERIGVGKTMIGEKILLRAGSVIARGTILLSPDKYTALGGKVDAWHKDWSAKRLERLKAAVGSTSTR